MTARVIAVCNQKGGVGKTTTTFHLARAGVSKGSRVLLVDADPQGNLTGVVTAEPVTEGQVGLADVLSSRAPEGMADVIVEGVWPGLDVVPSSAQTLALVRDELVVAGPGREGRLRAALASVADQYDLILIDCGPSLDQLTINAMTAAHGVLIPTQARKFGADGLAQLLDTIAAVREHYNPGLRILGVLVNLFESQTSNGQHWMGELRAASEGLGITLLEPAVPKRVVLADAAEAAVGLDQWGSASATELADLYAAHLATIERGLE